MSPAHETQSMWEIRLLRGRLPRKGGGLTGMYIVLIGRINKKINKLKYQTENSD